MKKNNLKTDNIIEDEHQLWGVLHQTFDYLLKCEQIASSKAGISIEKYKLLAIIKLISEAVDGKATITTLAYILNRSVNGVSTIIDRMEKDGLIEKIKDPIDHRLNCLMLTKDGEIKLREAAKPNDELMYKLLSVYTGEELETLLVLLEKLQEGVFQELGIEENRARLTPNRYPYNKMVDFFQMSAE